jgi:hypothetical protein
MTKSSQARRLHVPVRFVDGVWECALGGPVPVVAGTEADLVVDRAAIADKAFLKALNSPGKHKVLDDGARLLVTLTIKPGHGPATERAPPPIGFRQFEGRIATEALDPWSPETLSFVEVRLAKASTTSTVRRAKANPGLWLITQGVKTTGILSGPIALPAPLSEPHASSLNHAVTRLSEIYETWRISHTGNVYTRVLYQAKDQRWYPLDMLRGTALDNQEHAIAGMLWDEFMKKMRHRPIQSDLF